MLLTFAAVLIALMFLIFPLRRNAFFVLYFALMILCAYGLEYKGIKFPAFSKQSFLMFVPCHFVLINLVTIVAYGADKNAARKGAWRVPEIQLHTLELLGGWIGALVAQRLFHHKNKKKSYQMMFWFVLALQIAIVYYVLNLLKLI